MSWDSYIQDQLLATKCIKHAIICGHDANVWAKSTEINVSNILITHEFRILTGAFIFIEISQL